MLINHGEKWSCSYLIFQLGKHLKINYELSKTAAAL